MNNKKVDNSKKKCIKCNHHFGIFDFATFNISELGRELTEEELFIINGGSCGGGGSGNYTTASWNSDNSKQTEPSIQTTTSVTMTCSGTVPSNGYESTSITKDSEKDEIKVQTDNNNNSYSKKKINWFKEISECFSGTSVGFSEKAGITIPDICSINFEVSLVSVEYDKKDGNILKQGVSASFEIGTEAITTGSQTWGYERSLPDGSWSGPFDLCGYDFEASEKTNLEPSARINLPIPFFNLSLDISEIYDLLQKL